MDRDNLENDLRDATSSLLNMAREQCYNPISDNCLYILNEIPAIPAPDFSAERKRRNRINKRKPPVPLAELIPELENLYDNLHDVNLYIYKTNSRLTVVDIRYYLKTSLDEEHRENVKKSPMLHCKVSIPPYAKDQAKFDIHWELGGLRHRWRLFWWRRSTKRELKETESKARK